MIPSSIPNSPSEINVADARAAQRSSACAAICAGLAALVLSGCATMTASAPPLTVDQLVERAKKGESTESLLASLRGSRERFTIAGSEFAKLKERGLPEPVLDELQSRELQAAKDEEWLRSSSLAFPWWRFQAPYYTRYVVMPPRPITPPKTQ
ncbi:MAG: hypothetical protein EAZ43_14985 [Betaproteobacteria bacterium]|nr:MAG: hypothetical protein EAZ43_14985 [Betaproteobacteria bacterium]